MKTATDNQQFVAGRLERWVTGLVVAACSVFVFWQLQPSLIFSDTTPTGGDMGAHVWGPAFLRDELLPNFRLTGWTPDWYSGFPAFHFYFVLPALSIVILDVGLNPFVSLPIVGFVAAFAAGSWFTGNRKRAVRLGIATAILAPLLISLPYNVAFKLIAVSGVVLFPVAAWALGHLSGLRFPGPAVLAVGSLAFAFDRSFNIYGGNIASTLAGEFAASISLALSLVALGFVIRGTKTGEGKVAGGVFIALTGLSHLLPAFWLLCVVALLMVLRIIQRRFAAVPWIVVAGALSGLVSAFWVLPFALRSDFLNDMGWERIEIIHSPLVTRSNLNPANVLSDYPPLPVLLTLAFVGVVLSMVRKVELGGLLTLSAAAMAAAFVFFPDGRLWNARILPFYYLSVALLAALGVALVINELARTPLAIRMGTLGASAILLIPNQIRGAVVWPEPGGDGPTPIIASVGDLASVLVDYIPGAGAYAIRVLAIFFVVTILGTEIPRQLKAFLNNVEIVAVVVAAAVLIATPARDVQISTLTTRTGALWALVLLLAVATIIAASLSALGRERIRRQRFAQQETAAAFAAEVGLPAPLSTRQQDQRGVLAAISRYFSSNNDSGTVAAPVVAAASVFILLGLALNSLGGIDETVDGRSWSFAGLDITSNDDSFVRGWSAWNFSGLEGKEINAGAIGNVGQGGFQEYQQIQRTMLGVGQEIGCGRAMWEFAPELNRYGTTMAMMLLPLWTDGCIGSMEGLFFEATPTVPYHFLLQSDLSAPSRTIGDQSFGGPSQAMRDLPYGQFDIDRGVERMNELGVRYYLAFSPSSVQAAREHPGLTEVAGSAPWVVFETTSVLVEPLSATPVVIDGVDNGQDEWLDVGVEWFGGDLANTRPASSGPEEWASVSAEEVLARYEAEGTIRAGTVGEGDLGLQTLLPQDVVEQETVVSNTLAETDRISFTVDQIGTPILIRSSFFPAWEANGAEGPFRVAPNFMVVVPTSTDVELVFARTATDWVALLLTGVGLVSMFVVGGVSLGRGSRRGGIRLRHDADELAPGPIGDVIDDRDQEREADTDRETVTV